MKFNIAPHSFAIAFGSDNGNEKRKGFDYLFQALQICYADASFLRASDSGLIHLLAMGETNRRFSSSGWPVISAGRINSDSDLNIFYSAADVIVIPSLEDTLPLTMLEAMASGTPAITFDSPNSGMRDVIQNNRNGILVQAGDSHALASAILSLCFSPHKLKKLQDNCRKTIEKNHYFTREAEDYATLFRKIIKSKLARPTSSNDKTFGILFSQRLPGAFFQLLLRITFYRALAAQVYRRMKSLARKLLR
jgi:glycosyltransferase involved in cell wall biosynthesis